MAHKKHQSKHPRIHHTKHVAKETAKEDSIIGPQPPMSAKRVLTNDVSMETESDRSNKRRKINGNNGLDHHNPASSDLPGTAVKENTGSSELGVDASAQELPPEVQHLSSKYDFTTMSILSSAKIGDKVKKLLLRVEKFNFADPNSKPGVVVLHAKSEVASKMVSIVGIARQDIEQNKGDWWQYSKIHGQIAELRSTSVKRRDDGKTILEWQRERAGEGSRSVEKAGDQLASVSEVQHGREVVHEDEEMVDAFESMADPKEAGQGAKPSKNGNGRKIRSIPVMTIYFARVPVPGLKELYGYELRYSLNAMY